MKNNNSILVSGAVVFRDYRGKQGWLMVKQSEELGWEIAKVMVRRGESSVHAVIRMTGEQAGMTTRVLEEAGRINTTSNANGKAINKRLIYYLMQLRSASEVIGFADYKWAEYGEALRKLASKKEQLMLRQAKEELKKWQKVHQGQL